MAKVSTRDLKHRIALCRADDIVSENGNLIIVRTDVVNTWAKIEAKATSQFSRSGDNLLQEKERQTHLITIRLRRDIDVTNTAWIYEERMQSGARWFKVRGIKDDGEDSDFLVVSAALLERGMLTADPVETDATENPGIGLVKHGVVL